MNRDFDAIRKSVQRDIHALIIHCKVGNGFAANVSRGSCQLRASIRLQARLISLVLHGGAKHTDEPRILIYVKDDSDGFIAHRNG